MGLPLSGLNPIQPQQPPQTVYKDPTPAPAPAPQQKTLKDIYGQLTGGGSGGSGGGGSSSGAQSIINANGGNVSTTSVPGSNQGAFNGVPVVGGLLNSINPFNQPSTAGVQQSAQDAQAIQNQFLTNYMQLQPGQAPQIGAAQQGAASSQAAGSYAAKANAAPGISGAQMNAASLDTGNVNQDRGIQMGLAGQLQGTINGTTPSVADIQQKNAFSQLAAQQAGLAAASGRGGNQALAARTAMQNQGQLGAQAANQGALLRANEIATATGQLGQVGGQLASQDINVAGQNAANSQAANAANAQLIQQANLANQGNTQAANLQNASMQQQTNLANASNQQQTALANAQNQQTSIGANAANIQSAALANQQAQLQQQNQFIQQQLGLGGLTNNANQNQVNAQVGALNAQTQQKANQNNMISSGLASLATLSDKRLKTDMAAAGENDINEMLTAIKPVTYRYKQAPESAGGKFGVVAQDVERSPLGSTLVRDTPQGKAIDVPSATGALLASVSALNERIKRVEGKSPAEPGTPKKTAAGKRAA